MCMEIYLGEDRTHILLFADDQVLVASDEDDISCKVRKLIDEYNQLGLKMNLK